MKKSIKFQIKFVFLGVFILIANITALYYIENKCLQILLIEAVLIVSFIILFFRIALPTQKLGKELEKLNEENKKIENMRKEFVANVSHEIKTPLTSISGFIETLQSGNVKDEANRERFIEIIAIETARLERLIEDVLCLSEIEGDIEKKKNEIDVSRTLSELSEFIKPIADEKNIKIHLDLNETIKIQGFEDKFRQMMLNLIDNAVKYGNEDGNIWIKTKNDDYNHIISVKDDGMGIKEKDINRVTERFYRGDKSRSSKISGTGLGLSIAKHAAALLGGNIHIESMEGKGATFSFIIPKDVK